MILPDTFALSVLIGNTNIPDLTIFKDMLEYIMWTRTKTTLSSVTYYHSDQKVLAEAVDAEAARHDHPCVTWIQQTIVEPSNRVALISVFERRNVVEVHQPKKADGRNWNSIKM